MGCGWVVVACGLGSCGWWLYSFFQPKVMCTSNLGGGEFWDFEILPSPSVKARLGELRGGFLVFFLASSSAILLLEVA